MRVYVVPIYVSYIINNQPGFIFARQKRMPPHRKTNTTAITDHRLQTRVL